MALREPLSDLVPGGPYWYRSKLRRFGPVMALVVPVASFVFGGLLMQWTGSTIRGLGGFLLTALAAPTMLLLGVPVEDGTPRYVIAGLTSLVLWLGVGWWAACRATMHVVADWRDWWREYAWLVVPIWLGATIAFGVAYRTVL